MHFPRLLFIAFLLFQIISCRAQSTEKLVQEIAAGKRVEDMYVSESAAYSRQFQRFLKLSRQASTAELEKFTSHSSAAVRVYAANALLDRKSQSYAAVFLRLLSDTSLVENQTGCIVWNTEVANLVTTYIDDAAQKEMLSANETRNIRTADSIMLYTDFRKNFNSEKNILYRIGRFDPDYALEKMLRRYKPVPGDEKKLRELVHNGKTDALQALALFREDDDTSLIRQAGNDGFEAIRNFPHPVFFPDLKRKAGDAANSHAFDFSEYTEAVVAYHNKEADSLLTVIHRKLCQAAQYDSLTSDENLMDDYKSGNEISAMEKLLSMHVILLENYRPAFAPLLLDAWKQHHIQSLEGWGKILATNPAELAETSLGILENDSRFRFVRFNYGVNEDSLLRNIVQLIKKYHPEKLSAVAVKNIPAKTLETLDIFLSIAAQVKDSACAETILRTMKTSSQPYDLLAMSKIIFTYADKSYHQRAQEILKKNRSWGWNGTWNDQFCKLYRANGVPLD